jgi:hypothetical protein
LFPWQSGTVKPSWFNTGRRGHRSKKEKNVRPRQVVGALLIVVGLVSLLLGGFSWTREKTVLDIGPVEATTQERETIPIPPIVGGLVLAAGVVLLVIRPKQRA